MALTESFVLTKCALDWTNLEAVCGKFVRFALLLWSRMEGGREARQYFRTLLHLQQSFVEEVFLLAPNVQTLPIFTYYTAFTGIIDQGFAASISVIQFLILSFLILFYVKKVLKW